MKSTAKWKSAAARRISTMGDGLPVERAIPVLVERLLADVACPPTDLADVCARLNVVGVEDEDTPVVGELRKDGDGFRIICAVGQSPERRRFTIAHELGHVVMESSGPGAPRIGADLERICEMIAAEILMPRKAFEAAISGAPISARSISALAKAFGTSLTATAVRCAEFSPISLVDIQEGRTRWCKGPVRLDRYQLESLIKQAEGAESGDGLVFVGVGRAYATEWLRLSSERSGLLLLTPHEVSVA